MPEKIIRKSYYRINKAIQEFDEQIDSIEKEFQKNYSRRSSEEKMSSSGNRPMLATLPNTRARANGSLMARAISHGITLELPSGSSEKNVGEHVPESQYIEIKMECQTNAEDEALPIAATVPIKSASCSDGSISNKETQTSLPEVPTTTENMEIEQCNYLNIMNYLKGIDTKLDNLDNSQRIIIKNQDKMIKNQENMLSEIPILKDMIKDAGINCSNDSVIEYSDFPDLPVRTLDEFYHLEKMIKSTKKDEHNFARTLALVGGPRFSSVCHNIMKYLMVKEIAGQFSLKGKCHKICFNKLVCYKCVVAGIKMTSHGKDATIHEIDQVLGLHLVSARPRIRNRNNSSTDKARLAITNHIKSG